MSLLCLKLQLACSYLESIQMLPHPGSQPDPGSPTNPSPHPTLISCCSGNGPSSQRWGTVPSLSWYPVSAWLSPSFHSVCFKCQLLRETSREHADNTVPNSPVSVQSLGLVRFLQDFFRALPTFKILTHVLIVYHPSENVNPMRAGFCFIHESISEYRRCLQGLSK